METLLPSLLFLVGAGQLCVLVASSLVPFRLNWREEFKTLPRLHRQLYWVYGGYVVLSIIALGVMTLLNYRALAAGTLLARSLCTYAAVFWGVRLSLQAVLDAGPHLTAWWLRLGYHTLTILFTFFTLVYAWAALFPVPGVK